MIKRLPLLFFMFCACSSLCYAGAEPNMQEGMWEITSTMEMPGMPASIPPMKHTQCITKKDMIPQSGDKEQDCKITQTSVSGNTVTWTVKCSAEEGAMEGTGKITYSGEKFDGSMVMTMQDPGQSKMKMTQRMSGRRIGPCSTQQNPSAQVNPQ